MQFFVPTQWRKAASCLRLSFLLLSVTILAGPPSPAAPAPVSAATQSAIKAAYAAINTAFAGHDLTRFMLFFAPDYTVVDENGVVYSKEQTRRQYADQLKQMKTMQSRFTVENFTPTGSGIEVLMTLHTQGTGEKHVLFLHLKGKYSDDLKVHDLWVQTPQGWRIHSRKTLADKLVTRPG